MNHYILLCKLKAFGFNGLFLKWITSHLSNRSQSVKLSFHVSNDFHVPSGVPQGSHLGPLLFLVFINDLSRVFKNSIKLLLFADDAKLFCSIQSISDSETSQDQLNKFYTWSVNNLNS